MNFQDPELQMWNPGNHNYDWLDSMPQTDYLDEEDSQMLLQEPDRLYLIKWKHLSYLESTWEPESLVDCRQKIMEFK